MQRWQSVIPWIVFPGISLISSAVGGNRCRSFELGFGTKASLKSLVSEHWKSGRWSEKHWEHLKGQKTTAWLCQQENINKSMFKLCRFMGIEKVSLCLLPQTVAVIGCQGWPLKSLPSSIKRHYWLKEAENLTGNHTIEGKTKIQAKHFRTEVKYSNEKKA